MIQKIWVTPKTGNPIFHIILNHKLLRPNLTFGVVVLLQMNTTQWYVQSKKEKKRKKDYQLYSCALQTKHFCGVCELETNFEDGTAIRNSWIFYNFVFWKARPSVQHGKTSKLHVSNQLSSQSEGIFDSVTHSWHASRKSHKQKHLQHPLKI